MTLALILTRPAVAPDQFSIFEHGRKVGRVRKAKNQWEWDVDWFGVGLKLVSERRAAGAREASDLLFKRYWDWVVRSGVEKFGGGYAPTRDKAVADFKAAWGYVNEAGRSENNLGPAPTGKTPSAGGDAGSKQPELVRPQQSPK